MPNPKPKFFASEEIDTLDLGDGYWVELKKELDYGEESELEGGAIKAGGINDDGTPKWEFSLRQQRGLLLGMYVVDWNVPGADGKTIKLPDNFTRRVAILSRLSPVVARKIAARIEQIRLEAQAVDALNLSELKSTDPDPTPAGAESETPTPSSSANGSAVSAIETSSGLPTALSALPSL